PPAGTSADMILRGANASSGAGQYQIYNIGNNAILASYSLGQVGTEWGFVTLGGFFGNHTTDMLLRNGTTGGFEVYDISNQITGATFIGAVGVDWQFSGVGNFSSVPGESDLLLRNVNTGGWKSTTSATISSPARPSSARSVWTGSTRASARCMGPAHP